MLFKKGHTINNGRIPWDKGLTKETDERIRRIADKKIGKHPSIMTREKQSIARAGKHYPKLSLAKKGKLGIFKGKCHTPESRDKMSKIEKNQFAKGIRIVWNKGLTKETDERIKQMSENAKVNPNYGMKEKHHTNKTKEYIRLVRLNQVFPSKDTQPELKVQTELFNRELAYYKHYPVLGQPDIAFPDKKIAIFCDGCYWHKCSECGFGNGREKDSRINEQLRSQGWLVLRFWEHEINTDVEAVVDEIEEIIYKKRCEG